jgi:uncharacterized protein (DUF2141 family)
MGTGTHSQNTQAVKVTTTKPPKCSICRRVITDTCDWRQGRCPHVPSMAQQIINNPYKARFYNLIKFFKGKK